MSMNELEQKVQNLRELKRLAEELETEITATTDELKAYMQDNAADELMGPTFHITWKPVSSTRLDGKAVKAANPELWELCSRTTTTRRFILA